jgi:PAT family beta-lactamase induction signal transducer AmpG
MALTDPKLALQPVVWCALAVAFGSATQDIALDAFRIESADTQTPGGAGGRLPDRLPHRDDLGRRRRAVDRRARRNPQRVGDAAYLPARHPGRWPTWPWPRSMLLGMATVLLSPEPAARAYLAAFAQRRQNGSRPRWFDPFADFLRRYGKQAC